ncbi:hypothetical protein ACFFWC_31770 [Plantactinospora siamensis]|uniref:Uncharacterized protein n=1 Tax=Plantactinospora siamensis TaxID=555372 RepID=A0ABV6P4X9_9ACTN
MRPAGVGKTAVGWEIYSQLVRSGVQTGYVDIDQLGMCFPEAAADPGRHRMKARNLAGVVAGYRAAGARCVVVSGVVDAEHGAHRDELPETRLTICRLRADEADLARRFVGREGHDNGLADILREAVRLDAGAVAEVCVDSSGLTVAEVARRVRDRLPGWPPPDDPPGPSTPTDPADRVNHVGSAVHVEPADRTEPVESGPGRPVAGGARAGAVVWLCGATGVGKSTVGFQLYLRTLRAGRTAAFLDLDQLGFCGPTPADDRVRAGNLGAVWRTFHAAGAQALVMVGPAGDEATIDRYAEALPGVNLTVCRLHAGRTALTDRILARGAGRGSWAQPGDPLLGRPPSYLRRLAGEAAHAAEALEPAGLGHRVDTDGRTVEQVVDAVVTDLGWPGRLR